MEPIKIQYHKSPCGDMILGSFDNKLCMCDWLSSTKHDMVVSRLKRHLKANFEEQPCDVLALTAKQLDEYFAGKRTKFDVPILLAGTNFQKQVWNALLKVPYGQTVSYLEIAKRINNPKAVRAAAAATGANSMSIIVPCHRIVGSDGKLVGYASGLDSKKKLLAIESQ